MKFLVACGGALRKGASGAKKEAQLRVEELVEPGRHAERWVAAERFPRAPQRVEPHDGLAVLLPLDAPAELSAQRALEDCAEVVLDPAIQVEMLVLIGWRAARAGAETGIGEFDFVGAKLEPRQSGIDLSLPAVAA